MGIIAIFKQETGIRQLGISLILENSNFQESHHIIISIFRQKLHINFLQGVTYKSTYSNRD
jgi:hypothetical protein